MQMSSWTRWRPTRNISARDVNIRSFPPYNAKKADEPLRQTSQKSSASKGGFGKTGGELHSHALIIPDYERFVHSKKDGIFPGFIV